MPAPDPWSFAADLLDPPAPSAEILSPVAFAEAHSRGRWKRAPHLEVIESVVLDAIKHGRNVIISVPVRHGKSELLSRWLPAWYLGTRPDHRIILATHEADFAASHGRFARDVLTEYGPDVFGIRVSPKSEAANRWDIAGHAGGMLTVGVGGSPIGRGANLMIIDDPFGKFEDAMSPLKRQRVQEWWTGTMASRVEPGGAVVLIMARWHEDDLAGFLLAEDPDNWHEVRLPAVADTDDDALGRSKGEALWPERWPIDELMARKRTVSLTLGDTVWLAQYQMDPRSPQGGMFPEDRWQFTPAILHGTGGWVRRWDLAASEDSGDWTVGVLMGRMPDERTLVADVVRGRWGSDEVRRQITEAARRDPPGTRIWLPQDPGQAGKDQAQQLVRMLAGYPAQTETESGSKEIRAAGWSAQVRARNVVLVEAEWNAAFVQEHAGFPRGRNDDQVDAAAGALNKLVGGDGHGQTSYKIRRRGR